MEQKRMSARDEETIDLRELDDGYCDLLFSEDDPVCPCCEMPLSEFPCSHCGYTKEHRA